jgi:hypothetical protein
MLSNRISQSKGIPLTNSKLIDQTRLNVGHNLVEMVPTSLLQKIYLWMQEKYIIPQMDGRRPYEEIWRVLYDAYRMRLKIKDIKLNQDDQGFTQKLVERARRSGGQDLNLTDTLVFDTVDRMANLTHFISWKDDVPVQFNPLRSKVTPLEDQFYSPEDAKYKSANALLEHFVSKENLYRKTRLASKDYYLYGVCFCLSNFNYVLQPNAANQITLKDLSITFDPISIRKVWINFMLPLSQMGKQPCPFWYEYSSHFAILQNQYDPALNPFGYLNLDKLNPQSYNSFATMGEQPFLDALKARLSSMGQTLNYSAAAWKDIAAKWTFMPMLPFDPETGEFEFRRDGKTPVPYRRFVWEHFGQDPIAATITPIRLQECDYYGEELPLYGSTHLEDLDSAAYSMSICEGLLDYAIELSTIRNQYIENKNQINNPTTWHTIGSPSYNQDVNKPGAKVEVMGPNDFGWRQTVDATQTTVQMSEHLRERAQTTSKAVDAIMGKAMGGRTSATEAQNVFQAAMSGVTTDINMFNFDTAGQYAMRVWNWSKWLDLDLLKALTGSYGLELLDEDRDLQMSLKFDVGSSFIESIVKQGHIRYFIETGSRRPDVVDFGECLTMLGDELRIKGLRKCIIPNGTERNITKSTEQAIKTYLNEQVLIDPSQDHRIAIEVKTRYLEDMDSVWNIKYGAQLYMNSPMTRAQYLAQQIQIHTNFYNIQMQQEMMMQIANLQNQSGAKGVPSLGDGSESKTTMPSNRGQV